MDDLAATLRRISAEHGADGIAYYRGMGLYLDCLGWEGIDRLLTNIGSRQRYSTYTVDMSSVLRACELVIGFPLLPYWTPEDTETKLVVLLGTNPRVSHGHTVAFGNPAQRLREYRNSGGEIWVDDPRATSTAASADGHIALRPGTDAFLLAWLVHELLVDGADRAYLARHCSAEDVRVLRNAVEPFTLDAVAQACDVGTGELIALLGAVRRNGRLAVLTGTGLSMGPGAIVADWLRLCLLIVTGSLDCSGGMRFHVGGAAPLETLPWTGHARADGSMRPGPASRPELGEVLGEMPAAALADEIEAGNIRALVVGGANPLAALPQPRRLRAALQSLEALVVVDCFASDLSSIATHVLPAAWQLEREDVSLYSDRSQFTPSILPLGSGRRQSWWIFADLARRMGVGPEVPEDDQAAMRAHTSHARDGYDALVGAGPHGIPVPVAHGWVRDKVLPGGCWRLAPADLPSALARVWGQRDDGPRLVVARRMASNNSAHYAG